MPIEQFRRLPNARARSTPPASGLTITTSAPKLWRIWSSRTGIAYRWSKGTLKKPWIWPACISIESTRVAPAVATRSAISFAVIGVSRRDLAVLAGVAVVRQNRANVLGRRPSQRVAHDQKLHEVLVGGRTRRLNQKDVARTHVLPDRDVDLSVRETADVRSPERHVQLFDDPPPRAPGCCCP